MNYARKSKNLRFVFLLALTFSAPANAYLDPGTGSIILQGIIAGIAMVAVTGKMYWVKIKSFFTKKPPEDPESENSESAEPDKRDTP